MKYLKIEINKLKFNKTLYLDKDGVLLKSIIRKSIISSPRVSGELKLNSELEYINKIKKELKFNLVMISNQPDLSKNLMSEKFLNIMIKKILTRVDIDLIYICPHQKHENCHCRKPRREIINSHRLKYKNTLRKEFFIGDQLTDYYFIKSLPIKFIYYSNLHKSNMKKKFKHYNSFKSIFYDILKE